MSAEWNSREGGQVKGEYCEVGLSRRLYTQQKDMQEGKVSL